MLSIPEFCPHIIRKISKFGQFFDIVLSLRSETNGVFVNKKNIMLLFLKRPTFTAWLLPNLCRVLFGTKYS